jgi:hypothetical protein
VPPIARVEDRAAGLASEQMPETVLSA